MYEFTKRYLSQRSGRKGPEYCYEPKAILNGTIPVARPNTKRLHLGQRKRKDVQNGRNEFSHKSSDA